MLVAEQWRGVDNTTPEDAGDLHAAVADQRRDGHDSGPRLGVGGPDLMAKPFETDLTAPTYVIAEQTTRFLEFQLLDENDSGIPAAELQSLTLTLYDPRTGAIINSRDDMSVLNANGGTVDAQGNAVLELGPADNVIVGQNAGLVQEDHVALLEWVYEAGTRQGRHLIFLRVENLAKVT